MEREETREWQCGHENWEERKSEGKRRFESVIVKKSERAPNQYCFPRQTKENIYIYIYIYIYIGAMRKRACFLNIFIGKQAIENRPYFY